MTINVKIYLFSHYGVITPTYIVNCLASIEINISMSSNLNIEKH